MKILQINGSARREEANSTRVADAIVARLKAKNPAATVVRRDLASNPCPLLDEAALGALFTPADQRSPEQAARVAVSDALVAELQAADVLVLGVPMYNFGIPVQLKSWVDGICRVGMTFKYTETGPQGMLDGNKKVYVGLARGGMYRDQPADTQVPYFKALFGFLGLSNVNFVYAEGLNMGPEAEQKGFDTANAEIEALLP